MMSQGRQKKLTRPPILWSISICPGTGCICVVYFLAHMRKDWVHPLWLAHSRTETHIQMGWPTHAAELQTNLAILSWMKTYCRYICGNRKTWYKLHDRQQGLQPQISTESAIMKHIYQRTERADSNVLDPRFGGDEVSWTRLIDLCEPKLPRITTSMI